MICTLGDLLLDVVVRLESPIAEDTDTYGRTRVGAGGQAANVAAWVAALDGRARFVGKRARDPVGRLLADELRDRGVEVRGPEVESGTGTVVSVARRSWSRPGSRAASGCTYRATASWRPRCGKRRWPPRRSRPA